MKTNNKLTFILILLLFTAGCDISINKKPSDINVRVGFDGLKMEFLKNTPPAKIFEGETFPIVLKVKNTGAYSLERKDSKDEKAILSLGVEKDYTETVTKDGKEISNTAQFYLNGKSIVNQNGDEEVISFNLKAGKIDPQSEAHQSTAIATLCYPYQTILDSTICVDTDTSSIIPGKKVCTVQDLTFASGQGAPVAITKIEVNMLPQSGGKRIRPQFLIYIENKGQGTVIRNEAVKDFCTKSETNHKNLNTIYVKAYLGGKKDKEGGDNELNCNPKENEKDKQGLAKLKDKKEVIRCVLEEGIGIDKGTYMSPLNIQLVYGYSQSISANYFIQKTAR